MPDPRITITITSTPTGTPGENEIKVLIDTDEDVMLGDVLHLLGRATQMTEATIQGPAQDWNPN